MSAPLAARFVAGWNRFFHRETSTFALGLFRVLFAWCLFEEVSTTRAKSVYAIAGDSFHLPYFDWLPPISDTLYHSLHDIQYPLIVLVGLGLFTRVAGWPLLAIQAWIFFTDQLNFRNHPYFFMLVLLLLLLGPCDESFSLRSALRARRRRLSTAAAIFGRPRPVAFQRLIQLTVCIAYFYAGVHKTTFEYLSGRILGNKLEDEVMSRTSGQVLGAIFEPATVEALLLSPTSMMIGSWMTVLVELLLPFVLWVPGIRPLAILVGVGFHLSIRFSMEITTFSYAMIGTYLLFLEPGTLPGLARRLLRLEEVDPRPTTAVDRDTTPRVE